VDNAIYGFDNREELDRALPDLWSYRLEVRLGDQRMAAD